MTAQLINNPWIFNPGDGTSVPFSINRFKIAQVEFIGYLSASDTCEVQDQLGNTVWYGEGNDNLETQRSGFIGWVNGILVPANTTLGNVNIPSGRLIIYFE